MSPFPAAIARARSEFGAGSGFVVAIKPPCTIGKTSVLVMPYAQQTRGHENGRNTPYFQEFAATLCGILDESGFATLKACISHKKAQEAQNTCKSAFVPLVLFIVSVRLTVGLRLSWIDSTRG